ncbi:ABC transporter permease [Streptomyces sp. NPDC023838]|uniref:ABC transporter permease n=1 Tax=Streptomyces sp. NPDC023838 TaxID=3154325 RepID=UPI0033DB62D9
MSLTTSITAPARIIRYSAANALADMRAMYTWKTWTFGWLGRMLAQVTFFAVFGHVIGSAEQTRYLLVGNAVMTCVIESMMVVVSTTWERRVGTLTLLSAAPAPLSWVFIGRSLQWPVSGTATSLVALFGLGPAFGVHWQPGQILPVAALVVLTAATTYCFGLFVAAAAFNADGARNIISNAAYLLMMAVCGVQVPTSYWPDWVRAVAQAIPLTHTLKAIRSVVGGDGPAHALIPACWAVLLGVGWLTAATWTFQLMARRGRRSGSMGTGA